MSVSLYRTARRHIPNGGKIRSYRENLIVCVGVKSGLKATDENVWGLRQGKKQGDLEDCIMKSFIIRNANLMQQGNFIDVFLARHVSSTYTHH